MRITTLLGSPRKNGNTATILGWVEDELAALGHEVNRIALEAAGINPVWLAPRAANAPVRSAVCRTTAPSPSWNK